MVNLILIHVYIKSIMTVQGDTVVPTKSDSDDMFVYYC